MDCISTRGNAAPVTSAVALVNGLAPDGGLYVPAEFPPALPPSTWTGLDDVATTQRLLGCFFDDLPVSAHCQAAAAVASRFGLVEPVPLAKAGGVFFLELFHGPTRAFKDVALSALPPLLTAAAAGHRLAVVTATSGDTGPAAMAGFAGLETAQVLVFYPAQGISGIQRRQMVCQTAPNVTAVAIEGNFDDAQAAVKAMFADAALVRELAGAGISLTSANSINLGRLVPQLGYWLHAYGTLVGQGAVPCGAPVDIVVPTGNFGNLLAAWWARRLGLPVRRLICATNENDVLAVFLRTGVYDRRRPFQITNSPSMDILVSSNLERLLHDLAGSRQTAGWMRQLQAEGHYAIGPAVLGRLQELVATGSASPAATEAAIARLWHDHGYLADPHTAVAWDVWRRQAVADGVPVLIAATASPWKFPATVGRSLGLPSSDDDFAALARLAAATGQDDPLLAGLAHAPVVHCLSCQRQEVSRMLRQVLLK
jgi:threonine synthase